MPVSGSLLWKSAFDSKPRRSCRSLTHPPHTHTHTSLAELAPSPAAVQGRLYLSWPVVAMAEHPHVVHAGWKSAALYPPGPPCWCEKCLAVWKQLMLTWNLRRRKWIIEHLSLLRHAFEDLSAAERNTAPPSLQVWLAKQTALLCLVPFMQSDAAQCLLLAARGARRQSGGMRASKGLSERAPFPPGHILHYPTRWESNNPRMRTRTEKYAHTCRQ